MCTIQKQILHFSQFPSLIKEEWLAYSPDGVVIIEYKITTSPFGYSSSKRRRVKFIHSKTPQTLSVEFLLLRLFFLWLLFVFLLTIISFCHTNVCDYCNRIIVAHQKNTVLWKIKTHHVIWSVFILIISY